MRRNQTVPRPPQRMPLGQRFRIRHVEGGASDPVLIERLHQGVGVHDGAARDVGDEGAGGTQEGEVVRRDELGGGCGEGAAEHEERETG